MYPLLLLLYILRVVLEIYPTKLAVYLKPTTPPLIVQLSIVVTQLLCDAIRLATPLLPINSIVPLYLRIEIVFPLAYAISPAQLVSSQ